MKKLFLLILLLPLCSYGSFELSEEGEIHIITCGPYHEELYSAFGHSAIRVKDPVRGWDLLYNYGVFDFNQPNFYLNFAKGHLYYRLAVMDYEGFRNMYIAENRYIHEQVLNLSSEQKQQLFEFLQWNSRSENMTYNYDYFYDNCATRVRDAVKNTFKEKVQFDGSYIKTEYSIRDLTDAYLQQQPWGDLGIDLCLGLPMDKEATPWMYMFLPDYIESGFNNASIMINGQKEPLVKETIITYESKPEDPQFSLLTPLFCLTVFLAAGLLISFLGFQRKQPFHSFDIFLMGITGLLGWFLLILWLLTDHKAAAYNLNLLWAFPLYFPIVFWLLKKQKPLFLKTFFGFTAILHLLTLLLWIFLPQDLNPDLAPLVILLGVRSFIIYKNIPGKKFRSS